MSVILQSGPLRLELAPDLGGSVLRFTRDGRNLLRPAPDNISPNWSATQFAAFPLVPFCGRIANATFTHAGQSVHLPRNLPPESHAIHGFGWQSAWTVTDASATQTSLHHTTDGTIWPWKYSAQQDFALTPGALTLTLSLTNHGDTLMPAGFGWHPYFPRAEARLCASTVQVWSSTMALLPVPAADDLSSARLVADLDMDCTYDVAVPVQTLIWPDLTLTLKSDPVFGKLVVYVPLGEDYFCVEPVSHAPGAINSDLPLKRTGLHYLNPDQTLSGRIELIVD